MIPCLHDLIPKKYLDHIALLVTAVHTLLSKSLLPDEVDSASKLFIKYLVKKQLHYGKKCVVQRSHFNTFWSKHFRLGTILAKQYLHI